MKSKTEQEVKTVKDKKAKTNNEYEQMLIDFVKEEFKGVI